VTSRFPRFCLIAITSLVALGVAAQAQEYDYPYQPSPTNPGGATNTWAESPGPVIPGVSDAPPMWTQQQTTTNRAGTVENTHRWAVPEDGSAYQRQHEVTNPHGQMIQSWQRAQTEEGYLYRRAETVNGPDETPLRQHQQTRSGTDPYNVTRQQQVQLRDGRTITHEQTRSWDGTTGTRERTFVGPNAQQHYSQRAWSPDDATSSSPAVVVPGLPSAGSPPPEPEPKKSKTWGWLEKLNPFRKGGPFRPSKPDRPSTLSHGSGFTVGSGQHRGVQHASQGLTKKQPGEPSTSWHRPPWPGSPHASNSPASRSSHGRK